MTDPNSIKRELNIILDQLLMQAAICPDKVDVHISKIRELVSPALDAYARILAANPDVREIEERHAAMAERIANARKIATQNPATAEDGEAFARIMDARRFVYTHETADFTDMVTLLDVVRRKDAEIQELRRANETFIGETWKTERELIHAANKDRDAALAALATSQAETARWSVIANDHQDALVEARRRIEQLTTCPPASAADIAEVQARVADDYLAIQDGIRRYRRVICAEHRFVGQTEMGARIDVEEWESERGMLVRQNP